jgi:hypothetical protein
MRRSTIWLGKVCCPYLNWATITGFGAPIGDARFVVGIEWRLINH